MLLKDDNRYKQAAYVIMKKLRGAEDYENMKESNEEQLMHKPHHEGAESDMSHGKGMQMDRLMKSLESGDKSSAMDALVNLIEMVVKGMPKSHDE